VEEPGDPKRFVCAHPSEYESGYVGCQVKHYLLVNAPILDWLAYWILTIGLLAVGAVGGVETANEPNPHGMIVSVFLTKTRNVASVVKVVSMVVVDRALVERK
jgi:hypothetical protein